MNFSRGIGAKNYLRFIGLLLGLGVMVWLPIEESNLGWVLLFSGAICSWFAALLLGKLISRGIGSVIWYMVVGAGAGLLLAPMAILLMALKSGIHGHGLPDYSAIQMVSVISRMPYFLLSGILIGSGYGLWRIATKQQPASQG